MKLNRSISIITAIVFSLLIWSSANAQSSADSSIPYVQDSIYEKVDVPPSVDIRMWRRHVEKQLLPYIADAARANMKPGQYKVEVRFLVEADGRISDVKALNDPGYGLAKGAEKVIKTGPKWTGAELNGRKVRTYHTQPVIFYITQTKQLYQ